MRHLLFDTLRSLKLSAQGVRPLQQTILPALHPEILKIERVKQPQMPKLPPRPAFQADEQGFIINDRADTTAPQMPPSEKFRITHLPKLHKAC